MPNLIARPPVRSIRGLSPLALALAAACGPLVGPPATPPNASPAVAPPPPAEPPPPVYEPALVLEPPVSTQCAARPDGLAWDLARAQGMDHLALDAAHLAPSPWTPIVMASEGERPAIFDALRGDPRKSGCVTEAWRDTWSADRPPSALIRAAARALGAEVPDGAAPTPAPITWPQALATLCEVAGGCEVVVDRLDTSMQDALTPVIAALADVIVAREAMMQGDSRGATWWHDNGGHLFVPSADAPRPNPAWAPDRALLAGGRSELYAAAQALTAAIEGVDWRSWADRTDLELSIRTPRGDLRITGGGDDVHPADARDMLLVDLGGDDVYLGPVAANADAQMAVSVAVDVAGHDLYAPEMARTATGAAALDDGAGRGSVAERTADASRSRIPRQAGARLGVAVLFDLGGDDRYVTMRGGQASAQQGVAVLYDAAGDDVYLAESFAQGSAQMGIALAIDVGGGSDQREALHAAQGFGASFGFGALLDDGGADEYRCLALPARYPAPQDPSVNASFCQGAGQGFFSEDAATSMPGGIGLLVGGAGSDVYEASIFGQGAGYWAGTGVLLEAGGDDLYRHDWYAAGAGVHFGLGILVDLGDGADRYAGARNMAIGVGHHFGLGLFVEDGGADRYELGAFSAGAATCGSTALFVDVAGDDVYATPHNAALGVADLGDCDARGLAPTRALALDAAGVDVYPPSVAGAGDGATWGSALQEHPTEQAVALDSDGSSGLELGSAPR